MIKSQYADPRFQDHGFVNHIAHIVRDCGVIPGTTTPLIECYKIELIQNLGATSGTGGKPRNIALFRKVLGADPLAGAWQKIGMWSEGIDYEDAAAAGSVDIHPISGDVHVVLSFGKKNSAGQMTYQPWEDTIARASFAPPIVRLGDLSIANAAEINRLQEIAFAHQQLIEGIQAALANVAQGGLSAADAELLRWLRTMPR